MFNLYFINQILEKDLIIFNPVRSNNHVIKNIKKIFKNIEKKFKLKIILVWFRKLKRSKKIKFIIMDWKKRTNHNW